MTGFLSEAELKDAAIRLLARREYTCAELRNKLSAKTSDAHLVEKVLGQLIERNYQSDARYVDSYLRYAMSQGKGPLWIKNSLRTKGIALADIEAALAELEADWLCLANEALARKFKQPALDAKEKARQFRYLAARGFSPTVIQYALQNLGQLVE